MQQFLRCPEQCRIAYAEGWTPRARLDMSLMLGNIGHYVLEHAYASTQPPLPGNVNSLIRAYELQETNQQIYDNLESDQLRDWDTLFAKAETLLQCYFMHRVGDFNRNWEFTETVFKVPYVFPDGVKTYVTGKIDGGFESIKDDSLELMDHKFKGRVSIDTILTLLPSDFQVNTYLWAMRQLYPERKINKFYYNVIKNPQIKIDSRKKETVEEYKLRLYEKIMDDKNSYFIRSPVNVSNDQIDEWGETVLAGVLRDMRHWYDTNYQWPGYYNSEMLLTPHGTLSPYVDIILYDDYSKFFQRRDIFQELVE